MHQLGAGVLGPVFRASAPDTGRPVAVKALHLDLTPELADDLAGALRQLVETGLEHPGIVTPLAAGCEGSVPYLVLDYVAAESLDVAMRHYAPAASERAVPLIQQLADALDAAHGAGVVHGSLHLRDVFVAPDEARATGFGVARALEDVGLRAPVRRPYAAPEVVAGRDRGPEADRYALAAIAYELLTGRRATGRGEEIVERLGVVYVGDEGTLPALQEAFAWGLAEDPAGRPGRSVDFVTTLADALRVEVVEPEAVSTPPAAAPAGGRSPARSGSGSELAAAPLAAESRAPGAAGARETGVPGARETDGPAAAGGRAVEAPPALEPEEPGDWPRDIAGADAEAEPGDWPGNLAEADGLVAGSPGEEPDAAPDRRAALAGRGTPGGGGMTAGGGARGGEESDAGPFEDLAPLDDLEPIADEEPLSLGSRIRAVLQGTAAAVVGVLIAGFVYFLFGADFGVGGGEAAAPGETLPFGEAPAPGPAALEEPYDSAVALADPASPVDPAPDGEERADPAGGIRPPEREARGAGGLVLPEREARGPGGLAPPEREARLPAGASSLPRAGSSPAATEPTASAGAAEAGAPAAGAAPAGWLLVRTFPPGATVTVDGVDRGQTPLALRDVPYGTHRVEIRTPGYEPQAQEVVVSAEAPVAAVGADLSPAAGPEQAARAPAAGDVPAPPAGTEQAAARPPAAPEAPAPLPADSAPAPAGSAVGSLAVESRPAGASVVLDGAAVGATPVVVTDVRAGRREVRIEHDGYEPWVTVVEVPPFDRIRVAASLDPARPRP